MLSSSAYPPGPRKELAVHLAALLVGLHGVFILVTTLFDQLAARGSSHLSDIVIDVPLLVGLSLLYLSALLFRRKETAWLVGVAVYVFFLGFNLPSLLAHLDRGSATGAELLRGFVLPLAVVALLVALKSEFVVKSDIRAFRSSLKFVVAILLLTLAYGVSGFMLLDKSDFHHEIGMGEAFHRTIDQFDLTTNHPLQPRTKRAHLFTDSLSFVSVASLVYVAVSLFQPLRARLSDQPVGRTRMLALLERYRAPSEDFFKLWPHDKHYYFNAAQTAGLAFRVQRGVALCLGDPVGDSAVFPDLLASFSQLCFRNGWLLAFIHTEAQHQNLYAQFDFSLQKIGQEAVVDVQHFQNEVAKDKYFRNIHNRFERERYSYELLQPPHHTAVLGRLQAISDEWLARPGRVERGYVMGYFSAAYLQQCPILVARDAAGTIQGFLNQLPAAFDTEEATFDILRQTDDSLGNTNDYLLMSFIEQMAAQGFKRVNLGLAPLVGLDADEPNKTLIDSFLRFAYVNGDRFYSFSGLHRFKAKYQPEWRDRFIVYRGGVRGFARTMNALLRAMQLRRQKPGAD